MYDSLFTYKKNNHKYKYVFEIDVEKPIETSSNKKKVKNSKFNTKIILFHSILL